MFNERVDEADVAQGRISKLSVRYLPIARFGDVSNEGFFLHRF